MPPGDAPRVAYVLKRYPRLSETFIVNEILAHEAAGLDIEIFSLRATVDTRFHEAISRVRAPVTYIPSESVRARTFWPDLVEAARAVPDTAAFMETALHEIAADLHQAALLARLIRKRRITHMHAHFGTVSTTVARLTSWLTGVPYTFTAHAKDIFHDSVVEDDLRRKLHDARGVVTVSDFNLDFLRDTYGNDAARVQRIYNGLELDRFPYTAPTDRSPLIVGVGRLVPKKGFDVLVEACGRLARRGRAFRCELIGGGDLMEPIAKRVAELGLGDRLILMDAQPMSTVIERVRAAAALACPCVIADDGNRDGLPTVLLEAMALGTPCVGTDVTGIPEVVRHEETGLQVPQHDAEALADALERLLDDAALRTRLAGSARRLIEERFDIHHNAALIRDLMSGQPAALEAASVTR